MATDLFWVPVRCPEEQTNAKISEKIRNSGKLLGLDFEVSGYDGDLRLFLFVYRGERSGANATAASMRLALQGTPAIVGDALSKPSTAV